MAREHIPSRQALERAFGKSGYSGALPPWLIAGLRHALEDGVPTDELIDRVRPLVRTMCEDLQRQLEASLMMRIRPMVPKLWAQINRERGLCSVECLPEDCFCDEKIAKLG